MNRQRRRRAQRSVAVAAYVLAATAPAAAQSSGESPRYALPPTPTAVYHLADTLRTAINTGGGDQLVSLTAAMTLAATFQDDPGGVRVRGEIRELTATMNSPAGSERLQPEVEGAYEWVLGPTGAIEIGAPPTVAGPVGRTAWIGWVAQEMFPRFPEGDALPGDSWTDSLSWSSDSSAGSAETSVVYTYTLVGETVVDGRPLVRIDVAAEQRISGTVQAGGMSLNQTLEGTTEGFVLWDPERMLVHAMELSRNYTGSIDSPLGALPAKVTASASRWLADAPSAGELRR